MVLANVCTIFLDSEARSAHAGHEKKSPILLCSSARHDVSAENRTCNRIVCPIWSSIPGAVPELQNWNTLVVYWKTAAENVQQTEHGHGFDSRVTKHIFTEMILRSMFICSHLQHAFWQDLRRFSRLDYAMARVVKVMSALYRWTFDASVGCSFVACYPASFPMYFFDIVERGHVTAVPIKTCDSLWRASHLLTLFMGWRYVFFVFDFRTLRGNCLEHVPTTPT